MSDALVSYRKFNGVVPDANARTTRGGDAEGVEGAEDIELACWVCGKVMRAAVTSLPTFAFQLAAIANTAGWVGVVDLGNHRALVFCSSECRQLAMTKTGTYRRRPPKSIARL